MAKILNPKIQKGDLKEVENEKTDFFMRCRFKTHYLSIGSSERLREFKDKSTRHVQGKLKFQCHYEERKRRAESRRKKIIQKLKKVYRINVDELNENVRNEIIRKVDILEKENKEKEKRNVEKTLIMIDRLLQEQIYRRKVAALNTSTWRQRTKEVSLSMKKKEMISEDKIEEEEEEEEKEVEVREEEQEQELKKEKSVEETLKPEPAESKKRYSVGQEEKILKDINCVTLQGEEYDSELGSQKTILESFKTRIYAKPPKAVSEETSLKSTPHPVVFEDYEKDKVYLQKLIITNIGLETIHCRYLGIAVKDRTEKRFPIGVAVRDNIKLRPGLSCSTKIRFCCHDDDKEFECTIVYETRRQAKPLQHSCFFVPVQCRPAVALIKVTPLKIIFPALTWCSAVGPNGHKLLKKTIKIENTGKKGGSCRISDQRIELRQGEGEENMDEEEEGEYDEDEEREVQSSKTSLWKPQVETIAEFDSPNEEEIKGEESVGEASFKRFEESFCTAEILMDELIGNVFANFRFSEKYFIELPPLSVKQIEIRFNPEYQGFHHEIKYLQFEGCRNCVQVVKSLLPEFYEPQSLEEESLNDESIELVGDIKKLPLKSEPEVIDLKTCVINSGVYSGVFRVFNDSKGPYPVRLKIPSCLRRHGHVQPKAAIIQNFSFCDFSLRFYPRITLATDALQYFNQESGILEFPLFIQSKAVGGNSSDYIIIHVFALITDYALELSPPEINFGTVTTSETVRTTLQLTNHSLTIQEYGFLNLPKGVRVEPNMGFGRILPKESIPLYLLYSPVEDIIESKTRQETHTFRVMVTSLSELGGFREKLRLEEEKPFESILGEYEYLELGKSEEKSQEDENEAESSEKDEISEPCDEDEEESSIEGEEHMMKITNEKLKIRKFLKEDSEKTSELSFFKKFRELQEQNLESRENSVTRKLREDVIEPIQECDEEESEVSIQPLTLRPHNYNVTKCEALVIVPYCQISESVIQLPATPCSSFSLYRFQLNAGKGAIDDPCSCGFKESKKNSRLEGTFKFEAAFEFQNVPPTVKLEPESGFIKAGESLPITIIYRPEFPARQLHYESKVQKAKKLAEERKSDRENSSKPSSITKSNQKGKRQSSSMTMKGNELDDMMKMVELEKYDLFAGEKSLLQLMEPFCIETRIQCVIKIRGIQERTEVHDMILICPAVKPNFLYLGSSQEINFGKVLCGTKPKIILEIQNISLERISPGISLLNPVGSFSCPAALKKVEVDPEHVWRHPLTYSPTTNKGVEREYFEIHSGSSNLFLTVIGEGIEPEYKMTPNFGCCLVEAKSGTVEEMKIEIENLSPKPLQIQLATVFLKEGRDVEKEEGLGEAIEETKKENPSSMGDSTDKKRAKNTSSDRKICKTWDDIPDFILSELENFKLVKESSESKVFTLNGGGGGGDGANEITIQPYAKFPLQIRFSPQPNMEETGFEKIYAVKYKFLLERISPLKEFLVIGKISKAK